MPGNSPSPLSIVRYYNGLQLSDQGMGNGWSHTYSSRVVQFDSSSVIVYRPDGKGYPFTFNSTTWVSDGDVTSTLEETASGWTFTASNDTTEQYDVDGKLVSIADSHANVTTLTYDANDRLWHIENNLGEYLDFAYDPQGRIASIANNASQYWGYRYDADGNLEYVDNPDGTTKQHHYYQDPNFPHRLTGISDERGVRFSTYEYDSQGRAIASYHGPQTSVLTDRIQGVSVAYQSDGSRTVTNSRGDSSTYLTSTQIGVALVTDISGPGCSTCGASNAMYVYDPANNNLLSKTDNGITTKYGNYDANGNYQCKVEGVTAADTSTGVCAFDPVASPDARRTDYTYDPRYHSKIATITEPSVNSGGSKVITYGYDDFGNRTAETISGYAPDGQGGWNPVSRTSTYQFNGPLHQLSQIDGPRTDVSDITTLRYYADDAAEGNNRARLKEIEDASGTLVRSNIQYTATGKVVSESRPNGLTLNYAYYAGNDRLAEVTELANGQTHTTSWTYLPTGEVETITRALGSPDATTLTFGYDDARRLTRITDAFGNYIEYVLDTEGNREQENIHDSAGALKKALIQTFDAYNRLDTATQANEVSNSDYSPDGTLDKLTDGNSVVTDYSYDALKRLLSTTQDLGGLNALTQYGYDPDGRLDSATDPINGNTTYHYDDLGNLLDTISPDTGTTVYSSDAAGNVKTKTTAAGTGEAVSISYAYDALNRLTLEDAPGTQEDVTYDYDACPNGIGRSCRVDTGAGSTAQYDYDAYGNVTRHQGIDYTYDVANRLESLRYPSGALIMYHYDAAGRVSDVDLTFNGQTQSLATLIGHLPFGGLTTLTYGNAKTLTQTYDTAYRLTGQTVPGILDLSYPVYDGNGNPKQRDDGYGVTSSFSYDPLDRLDTATGPFGTNWNYDYDGNGNRNRTVFDNGSPTGYAYEPTSNRLDSIGATDVLLSVAGNTLAKGSWSYLYTARNRLASASESGQLIASYTYNGLGQRVSKTVSGTTTQYRYGLDGTLRAELDGTGQSRKEYVYLDGELLAVLAIDDAIAEEVIVDNGSTETSSTGDWSTKTDSQAYGADYLLANRNNIASTYRWTPVLTPGTYSVYAWWEDKTNYSSNVPYVIHHGGQSDTVYRDHTANGGSWQALGTYDFDGTGGEYIEVSNANGKATADAVRLVKEITAPTQVTAYYVHTDHLGTPVAMSDEGGNVVWRASYAPFGKAMVDPASTVEMNVRFPGQYYDQETGLHYNYFRYYDPETGRYVTSDPIGLAGGINPYLYTTANPLSYIDPFGLLSWSEAVTRYVSRQGGTLDTPFAEHDPGLGPESFPGFSDAINSGVSQLFTSELGYDTGDAPGRIVLTLTGSIKCQDACGQSVCNFVGKVGAKDDPWDFDKQPWGVRDPRGFPYLKEFSTRVGAALPGVPFTTRFTGPRTVRLSR